MNITLYTVDAPGSPYHGWFGVGLNNGKSHVFETEKQRTMFILRYQNKEQKNGSK